jgi:hypothetical protein
MTKYETTTTIINNQLKQTTMILSPETTKAVLRDVITAEYNSCLNKARRCERTGMPREAWHFLGRAKEMHSLIETLNEQSTGSWQNYNPWTARGNLRD